LSALWEQFQLLRPGWGDLVEIGIVAALAYRLLILLQRTRAMQMLLGVGFLSGVYVLARVLDFTLIRALLEALFQYGAIAALVVFQPELRAALARLGQGRMVRLFVKLPGSQVIDELIEATEELARTGTGALIALEGEVGLDEYARTGSQIEARVSSEILATIFTPLSPLHDGAVLVRGDMIRAAGAILPLTQTPLHDRTLGTRHRAALGLAEESDAFVIVVSEESRKVAVAVGRRLEVGVDSVRLRQLLEERMGEPPRGLRRGLHPRGERVTPDR